VLGLIGWGGKLVLDQRLIFSLYLAQGSEFAFVLLGFGMTEGVLESQTGQLLIAAVALTMALTPMVMLLEEKVLRPRFGTRETDDRVADGMDEDAPVILAGVGRFGNFVARMLRAQQIDVTVIDNDSEHIEFLRRLGVKAFYGDANRHDLLEAAGASKAKLLICTLDDEEKVGGLTDTARRHFPNLKIMTRALSRVHEYELINDGADYVIHQNSGSAIQLGEAAMVELGFRAHHASRAAKAFAKHDRKATAALAASHHDEKAYATQVRQSLSDLEELFQEDNRRKASGASASWDADQLREDTAEGNDSSVIGSDEK
jgi:CPA2 family monovalent cation:H+ antiporter-2